MLFKPLIKKNMKYIKFNQLFIHRTHNENEIKASPKIRVKEQKKLKYERQFHGKILS